MHRTKTPQLDLIRDQTRELLEKNPVALRVAQDSFDRVVEQYRPHGEHMRIEDGEISSDTFTAEWYVVFDKLVKTAPDNPLKRGRFYYYKELEATKIDAYLGVFWLVGYVDSDNPRPFIPEPEEHDTDSLWCWNQRLDPKRLTPLDNTSLLSNEAFGRQKFRSRCASAANRYFSWFKRLVAVETPVSGQADHVISAPENLAKPPAPPAGAEAIDAAITADHELILSVLSNAPGKCMKVHEVTSKCQIRNRETVGRLLRDLNVRGLVDQPFGIRKGYGLTDKGKAKSATLNALT